MNTKFAMRFAILVLTLAVALGIAPTAHATITTNGNGGSTDVGAWYLPYFGGHCANVWSFSGVNNLPLSYWTTISGSGALSGTLEAANPCDSTIISEDMAALAAAKIDFITLDLTNNNSTDIAAACSSSNWVVLWACDVATAVNTWNANPNNTWKIRYGISVAPSTSGGGALGMENLAQAVYTGFVTNSTFGGAANFYQINSNYLMVPFQCGPMVLGTDWANYTGDKTYGNYFYFGYAECQGAGSPPDGAQWGWPVATITAVDPAGVVEEVSPGWDSFQSGVGGWYSRQDGAFLANSWNVVFNSNPKPRIVLLQSFNDWGENSGVWINDTATITYPPYPLYNTQDHNPSSGNGTTGGRYPEAWTFPDHNNHPDGYWNYTTAAINYLRNGGTSPSLPQPAPNLSPKGTASASTTYNTTTTPASHVNDGDVSSFWASAGSSVPNTTQWIQLHFSSAQTFNTVVLAGRPDTNNLCLPVNFQIQVWNGSTWVTRVQETNFPEPTIGGEPIAFTWGSSDTTTDVRVNATQLGQYSNGSYYFELSEFEVLNEGSTPTTPVFANWGFEAPYVLGSYRYGPFTNGWTFGSSNTGVNQIGSASDMAQAPQGLQAAFIGIGTGTISQAITLPAGNYTIRFLAASRINQPQQTFQVYYGSTLIATVTPPTTDLFTPYVTSSFHSDGSSQTVSFEGTSSTGFGYLDEVQIFNQQ